MTIITVEYDGSPAAIRKRIDRKNTKYKLSITLQRIHQARFNVSLTDKEKLKQIGDEIMNIM